MQVVFFVLIGLAAGWIAGKIMKTTSSNWLHYLIVGVVGSLLGGFLFAILGLAATSLVGNLVISTVGAVVLIAGLRAYDRRRLL